MHDSMLFFSVPPPTEPSLDVGCSTNDECPDYTACENRQCINPCAYKNPCAPTAHCRVVRHNPICTCPDGYVGSPTTSCQLRKTFTCTGPKLNSKWTKCQGWGLHSTLELTCNQSTCWPEIWYKVVVLKHQHRPEVPLTP